VTFDSPIIADADRWLAGMWARGFVPDMDQLINRMNDKQMQRSQALPYVAYVVDDAANARKVQPGEVIPENARLIGWQCGAEPLFVAVVSYLPGVTLDPDGACELAIDYLLELGWFADPAETYPQFVL
jgi:hypothetical protein